MTQRIHPTGLVGRLRATTRPTVANRVVIRASRTASGTPPPNASPAELAPGLAIASATLLTAQARAIRKADQIAIECADRL